ncbi:alkane 1-monooxygenase [Porticoccaceae bacterium]|jgi:alkane 1-monooxygenase|nr:alkane 1-monooxygenase [Porticoccaceae bacterium]MBT7257784.1 alkane 1-monooxygenase [Porticoccaceae bacterium]MBT7905656.1 alkane 1-monooxygenase [Porticoccaceae bacterium]MDA8885564.1 alkane 1-monooxygenase [Porticoccaceae bacterium]MDA8903645.1 alkane 1-monooxygenase [Porticoccaceae bacterium]
MATYSIEDAQKGLISYNDKKRYLWLISVFMPVFPLMGVFIFYRTGVEWTLCLPLLLNYTLMPLLDWLIGSDSNNPPEELVPQLEADKYYRYLTYLTVPLHFVTLCIFAYVVGTNDLSWWSILVTAIIAGGYSGLGINTAHELGHKQTGIEKLLAKITLAVPAYGHFCVEHNRGHHVLVATPDDPASSRLGESIYAFTLREIPGTFKRGWELEKSRLQKQGKQAWSIDNEILQSYAISAVLQGALVYAFGWIMVPFLAVHNVWAWYQLTSANYIEHYGLLREKKDNGRYERCQPHHSWNANYIMSNLALFHLERHSDHHANPIRRYQSLRNFEDIPELPNGYYGMYLLAYIPWLWFKVMDHRVLELPHIQGDLSKVNICPSKRESIFAKYGSN